MVERKIRVLIFSTHLSETFVILRRNEQDITINVYCSTRKVSGILVRFEQNLDFLDGFSKTNQISNFTEIRLVGAEVFHAGVGTGLPHTTKLTVAF